MKIPLMKLLLACGLWLTLCGQVGAANSPPNIVFIYADDWGWGDLSCHGHPHFKTPHLDRLQSQGADFHRFTVASGVCSPSRAAILTGHYPARYGVHEHFAGVPQNAQRQMPDWLSPQGVTLPKLLKKAGYATAHFGKWHLTNVGVPDAPLPTEYGYDETAVYNGPGPQVSADPHRKPTDTDRAVDFIRRHADQPFFINLWVHASHTPHYPTKQWLEKFNHLNAQEQVYAAVLADADERIGQVLAVLDELQLTKNTLVIFSSDNGPENTGGDKRLGDDSTGAGLGTYYSVGATGGLRGRKRSLYQGGVNVPFLVRWPAVVAPGRIDKSTVITAVDLLPTLCAAAEASLPADYVPDGQNMLSALRGESTDRTKLIYWEWRGGQHADNWPRLGVGDQRWSLLMNHDGSRAELYDLLQDRGQQTNLAAQQPETVERLKTAALAWKKGLPTSPPAECFSKLRQ